MKIELYIDSIFDKFEVLSVTYKGTFIINCEGKRVYITPSKLQMAALHPEINWHLTKMPSGNYVVM